MARWRSDRDQLTLGEHAAALAARRPMHDDLVDRRRRQQLTTLALMARLSALLATRRTLTAPRRRPRRILAGRLRGVARRALDLTLELSDPLVLHRNTLLQPLDLLVHPHQHSDHDPLALLVDRLGLSTLHATGFATAALCPPTD